MDGTLERFCDLFEGRLDAYGTNEGGAQRVSMEGAISQRAIWEAKAQVHLRGAVPFGVYPQLGHGTVRWGCVDIDEDVPEHAYNLQTVLWEFGRHSWVERSRSKGYHVWIFLAGWTPAAIVRDALMACCKIAGCPDKEVNPKQVIADTVTLGNYVRLPYPNGWELTGRQVMIGRQGQTIPLGSFLSEAPRKRVGVHELEPIAELLPSLVPPVPPPVRPDWVDTARDAVQRMDGLSFVIWRDGPREGADRSSTTWNLITALVRARRHTEGEIVDLVVDADIRWGSKYMSRRNGRAELERQVRKAYG